MASDLAQDQPSQPHPYLHEPVLYISNLPAHVSDQDLAVLFEHCIPFRPRIARENAGPFVSGTIEFKALEKGMVSLGDIDERANHLTRSLFSAEKALATLQSRPVPNVSPPTFVVLSPYPPGQPSHLPPPGASPRLVKQLPPGYTDSQLYDLFRPFGPLASVRTKTEFGIDTGVVEFWREDDAKIAEENMHCAEVGDQNIAVQVYQPRRGGVPSQFSAAAPAFIPSGSVPYSSPQVGVSRAVQRFLSLN